MGKGEVLKGEGGVWEVNREFHDHMTIIWPYDAGSTEVKQLSQLLPFEVIVKTGSVIAQPFF